MPDALTIAERVRRIQAEAVGRDMSSWEKFEFLPSIKQRMFLTERQERVLAGIEARLFTASDVAKLL